MGPNNTNTPPIPNAAAPKAPTVAPAPAIPVETPKESNKLILWFVLGLMVIAVLVGGTYLFLSKQQAVDLKQQTLKTQTPAPVVQENLENDLNNISIDDGSKDFAAVDQDLQQL